MLFAAQNTGNFSGTVNLSAITSATIFGSFSSTDYVLPGAGRYLIKYGYHVTFTTAGTIASTTLTLSEQNTPSNLQTISFSNAVTGSPAQQMPAGTNSFIYTATQATPIRFSVVTANLNANRFYCEVYKVGA